MNENEINEKINPISLKKQTEFFFKKIKPNKIANNYLLNIRNNNNIKKSNFTSLNINQKYLLKNSDLSKLSELTNTNQISNMLNDTCYINQTAPNEFKNKKILNFKKINNINRNIKINYKHKILTTLLYNKNKNKYESNINNYYDNKNLTKNAKNSVDENYNFNNFNKIKSKNIKNDINKAKSKDIKINNSIFSKTLDYNILNSNISINSNSTRKDNSDRQNQEIYSFQGDSFKSINLIKENNERILNRLLFNKDNKNININIKYFSKKNISNINWIFYNTFNNIYNQQIILKNKDNYKSKIKRQKRTNIKNKLFQHGKSYNDIKINSLKKTNTFFASHKINPINIKKEIYIKLINLNLIILLMT